MKFSHICIILTLFQRGNGRANRRYNQERPILRVIGGRIANVQDFPSTACLILKNIDGDDFRGGAVIISEYWATTAAHCLNYINSEDVHQGIAFIRSNSTNWRENYNDHMIIEKHVHEQYDYATTDYDIALIKVKEPFDQPYEKPVELPNSNYEYVDGSVATVVGWGTTDSEAPEPFIVAKLRFANIKITNFNTCRDIFNTSDELVTDRMVCAVSPGKDACVYDSGGPLYQKKFLIGLVSWGGPKCADNVFPGVYTRLSIFIDWIKQKTAAKANIDADGTDGSIDENVDVSAINTNSQNMSVA